MFCLAVFAGDMALLLGLWLLTIEIIVWTVMEEEEGNKKKSTLDLAKQQQKEAEARREEMRKEAGLK